MDYFNWKQKEIQEEELGPFNPPENVPPLIRTKETGDKVYLVKDGYAHWVTSPEVLQAVGGDFGMVQTIDRSIFRQLRIAEKLTIENAGEFKISNPTIPPVPSTPPEQTATEQATNGEFKTATEAKPEFTTYDEPEVASAPKLEPIKGLTSIIIPVHWNSYPVFHYTGHCIGSIREHTNKEKTPYEIILVINGQTGITIDNLKDTYADKVIQNEENEGFSKAVNKGIRCASGEYIAIVNNDVLVFDHWLEDMQEALQFDLNLVMATPMYGKPFARAVEAAQLRERAFKEQNLQNGMGRLADSFSDFKDFSCILTRKKMFDQIGLFNEEFFMYCEDLDLMRRMDKEGLKYASTKRVNTTHIIGATSSSVEDMPEIMNESKAKLKEIWGY